MKSLSFRVFAGLMLAMLPLLPGCGEAHSSSDQQKAAAIVIISTPVQEEVVDYHDFTGRTDAKESVDIRARVTGFLKEVKFKEGEEVALNAPLYQIDDREYKADQLASEGTLAVAKSNQQRAISHLQRMELMKNKKAISVDEYEKAETAKKDADGAVMAAEAKEIRAKLNVEFSNILAPIAGKISRTRVTAGNLVTADSTLLTTIVSVEPMYVYFDVDERTLQTLQKRVRKGELEARDTAAIKVLMGLTIDEEKYPYEGTLNFLENRVDPQTGTVRVRAEFKNPKPEKGGRVFEAGMFARLRVPIGKPRKALLVTDRAIGTDQGQKFLYVVDGKNEVSFRAVRLGATHHGLRVIEEGLSGGEKIIIDGLQRVRPGSVVQPKPGDMRSRPSGTGEEKSDAVASAEHGHADKKSGPEKAAEHH